MSKEREALEAARPYVVDALEAHDHSDGREVLALIDAALSPEASPQVEAVAWRYEELSFGQWCDRIVDEKPEEGRRVRNIVPLYASPPASAGVRVKALEWSQNYPSDPNSQWVLIREIDRSYTIDPESNVFRLSTATFPSGEYGSDGLGLFPSIEAAKAVAQADYEARILSALEPAAPPSPAPVSGERETLPDRLLEAHDHFAGLEGVLNDPLCAVLEARSALTSPADLPAPPATGESVTEASAWTGPFKDDAAGALDSLRRSVAELLGEDPDTWPAHKNASLAISSAMAILMGQAQDAALAAKPGWREIGSAPVDGTPILIRRTTKFPFEEGWHVVRWEDDGWICHDGKFDTPLRGPDPEEWLPLLPAAPAGGE